MNAKHQLFTQVLPGLKERCAYFARPAVRSAADAAGLVLSDRSLNVYLHQAVKQGHIHDAGRGWYSRLSRPVRLDELKFKTYPRGGEGDPAAGVHRLEHCAR